MTGNDYRIRCEGSRIQLWINGYQTVDYQEMDGHHSSRTVLSDCRYIAVPRAKPGIRDIRIRELNGTQANSKEAQ